MNRPKAVVHKHKLAIVAAFLSFVAFAPAHAEDFTFSINPQDLSAALKLFAVQSHREIFFAPEVARGKKSKGIKGTVDDIKALKAILEGTGLNFSVTASNAILVNESGGKSGASQAGASTTSGSAPPNTGSPTRLAQSSAADSQSPAGSTSPENGQDLPVDASKMEDSRGLAEILVKGSRIMNVDVTRTIDDPQPYYIFDSETIEQSGATSAEDFLKQRLTMNTTFQTSSQQVVALGNTSQINLRGLGANETLILIDGRRSASVTVGGNITAQPDINGIPLSAIERIEVLPSSASAIYGGSAIGGVVNIILKRNFHGGELHVNYENTVGANAPLRTVDGAYGFSLKDDTQIMLSGHYADGETLMLQDRLNLVRRGVSTILNNDPAFLYSPFAPFVGGTTPNVASADFTTYPVPVPLTLRNGTPLGSAITYIPVGAAPGANIATGLLANAGKYNLGPAPGTGPFGLQSAIGSVPETKSFMVTIRRPITSMFDVFADFSTETNASRSFYDLFSGGQYVPSTAPDNPFQQSVFVNFPSAQSQTVTSDSVTQKVTAGLIAHLSSEWTSELDYTWSKNSFETDSPTADYTTLGAALANGTINPFVDTIAYPANLAPYTVQNYITTKTTLNDLGLRASGPVASLPWGRPTLTVGVEHRQETFRNTSDTTSDPLVPANNQSAVNFPQPTSTNSVYAEALVPIVTATNSFPLVHSLDIQMAGRSESYTDHVGPAYAVLAADGSVLRYAPGNQATIKYTAFSPTFALKYKPVDDVIFRVSYAKAFLPPTPAQLEPNPLLFPSGTITDPQSGLSYAVNASHGGNPSLSPQISKSLDIGLIWEPKEETLRGIRVDIEYYKITQPNYITNAPLQAIVSNPAYASRVTRDPTTGLITGIDDSPLNANLYKTQGWDLTLDYGRPTAIGTFRLHAVGTLIEHDLRQYAYGSQLLEFVGYPGDGGETKTKANATLSWDYQRWTAGWTTTYYARYSQVGAPGDPFGTETYYTDAQGSYRIPSQIYHTLFGSYSFTRAPVTLLSNLTVQFGIKNIFNTLPPFDVLISPYYYSPYGDPRLRDYWLSIRKSF